MMEVWPQLPSTFTSTLTLDLKVYITDTVSISILVSLDSKWFEPRSVSLQVVLIVNVIIQVR